MKVDYAPLKLSPDMLSLTREVIDGFPTKPIPLGWEAIIVYHPATDQYYSTISKDPLNYARILRDKPSGKWANVSLVLRQMIDIDASYQLFVFSVTARPIVEQWFSAQGKKRVATKKGDAAVVRHVLFEVTSNFNKVSRFVVAPITTKREVIIDAANKSIATWLLSRASSMRNERITMRVALRSQTHVNKMVFEPTSEVVVNSNLNGYKHNEFRSISMEMNAQAIRRFISSTITGK